MNEPDSTPLPDQPQAAPESVAVKDLDQFVRIIAGWHKRKVAMLEHFLAIPPGTPMQIDGGPEQKLEGLLLEGFKAGLQLALMQVGTLPFMVEHEAQKGPKEALQEAPAESSGG